MTESTTTRADMVDRTFREAERAGLKVAMQWRLAALALMGLWIGVTRPFPQNLVMLSVIMAFALIGVAQMMAVGSRFDRRWLKYLFATLDSALLAGALIGADLSLIRPDMPQIMLYRFGLFPLFLIPVAASAFAYSAGLVIWTGVTLTMAWGGAFLWISSGMEAVLTWSDIPADASWQAYLGVISRIEFAAGGTRIQESLVLLICTALIAVAVHRARGVVRRQAEGEEDRASLTRTFGRYVPEAVVARLIADGDALEPVHRPATVLFADLADFTAIAEKQAPAEVVAMLNGYFDAVAEAIARHGGVITQFQGDAVLATFNVPVEDPDHARQGVAAALDILGTIAGRRFNGQSLGVRIGVNTGDIVAGSVGSAGRRNYTVHGDAVNLAARLQALNKEHGTRLLVTDTTMQAAGDGFAYQPIGDTQVRGRDRSVSLFTVDV